MSNKKCICIVSGGIDSATLLKMLVLEGYEVHALSFDYGQRHKIELEYARKNCESLGVKHNIINLSNLNPFLQGSALTASEIEVPYGHYTANSMKSTVVPNRNMIMLSIATGYAVSLDVSKVFFGAHAGDHFIYRDCRPEFVEALSAVTKIANDQPVEIEAPFTMLSKIDIVKLGLELKVDFKNTWSCYNPQYLGGEKEIPIVDDKISLFPRPCLKCGTCIERAISFRDSGVPDPFLTDEEWEEALKIIEGIK